MVTWVAPTAARTSRPAHRRGSPSTQDGCDRRLLNARSRIRSGSSCWRRSIPVGVPTLAAATVQDPTDLFDIHMDPGRSRLHGPVRSSSHPRTSHRGRLTCCDDGKEITSCVGVAMIGATTGDVALNRVLPGQPELMLDGTGIADTDVSGIAGRHGDRWGIE